MVTNLARAWGARLVEPVARLFGSLGLTPNGVTVLGFLLTLAVAVVVALGNLQLAAVFLILTLAFDAVDGTLARIVGQTTRFGAFLDSTLDRWSEVALFVALLWRFLAADNDLGAMLACLALAASLLVSYTRARAEGAGIDCRGGMLTRFERLLILIIGLLLNQPVWTVGVIAVLAGFTAIQRIFVVRQAAQSPQTGK